MRVAIGGIAHETSTFARVPTAVEDFRHRTWAEGSDIVDRLADTKTAVGGFLDAARDADFEIAPTFVASALSGGIITAEAAHTLTNTLCDRLRQALEAGPIDGVLLAMHGAMIYEFADDAESYVFGEVRKLVGDDVPVLAELDMHANVTQRLVDLSNVLVAYDEYPHVDAYERGYDMGLLLARILRSNLKPTSTLVKIPLLAGAQRQYTFAEPMRAVKHMAHDQESERGVLSVSYLPGFFWADLERTGFSVVATTDGDRAQATGVARRLAQFIWDHRAEFEVIPVHPDEAVRRAMNADRKPVLLADIGDNPGGGCPADGTVLLEAMLRLGAKNAVLVPMNDPEVVETAFAAGVGSTIIIRLGGKTDDLHGSPLDVTARVVRLTDGRFVQTGPMNTGMATNMGPTAVLDVQGQHGGSVNVITTTIRHQPTDLEVLRSQGFHPTELDIIGIKSAVHYRAAFEPIAAEIIEADTPGLASPHLQRLTFHRLPRPLYPWDRDITWTP